MTIVYACLGVSLVFALLIALGSREKRNVLSGNSAFYYQRTIVVAIGSSGFMWILLSIATLWLAFPDGEIATGPLAAYVIVNAFVVIAIFCIYKWYRMYSVEIADNLIVRSFGGVREISFDSITKADIIDGKDTTRMVIFWGYPKKRKLVLSGLLIESDILFKEITDKLMTMKCIIKKRSYIGHWTVIH